MARGKSQKPPPMPGGMDHIMPTGGATPATKYAPVDMPHPMQRDVPVEQTPPDPRPTT